MVQQRKIMIIIWKWEQFYNKRVNDQLMDEKNFQPVIRSIKKGKGKYYEEYSVEDSDYTKNALVVAASIYNGQKTRKFLYKLIDLYTHEDHKVLLFLHRGNHYFKHDVETILEDKALIDKCFLFADGRDFIYYTTKCRGMLDDKGGFRNGRVDDKKVRVFDRSEKMILQPYFDGVWNYYQMEFRQKIKGLYEDIFEVCSSFLIPQNSDQFQQSVLIKKINDSPLCLAIRIKSFLGVYDDIDPLGDYEEWESAQDQLERLSNYEKTHGQSFIFDDCRANLEQHDDKQKKNISKLYEKLTKQIESIYPRKLNGKERTIDKSTILDLRPYFSKLIEALPG